MWPGCLGNAVLKRLALPAMDAVVRDALRNGRPPASPAPGSASRPTGPGRGPVPAGSCRSSSNGRANSSRAASWLLTSIPSEEMSGEDLLALYRKRAPWRRATWGS